MRNDLLRHRNSEQLWPALLLSVEVIVGWGLALALALNGHLLLAVTVFLATGVLGYVAHARLRTILRQRRQASVAERRERWLAALDDYARREIAHQHRPR